MSPTEPAQPRAGIRNTVLVTTMVASTFQLWTLAVLASTFIDEFDLTRLEIGLIGSLNTAVGAVSAPFIGRLTDAIGARQATAAAQLMSSAGLAVMALAGNTWVLVLSALILGVPQGWGNPATNALIAERVPAGRRGTVTGIKQSGVQFAIFLSGLTLPGLSDALGWRGALWLYAATFAAIGLLPFALPARVDSPAVPNAAQTAGDAMRSADSEEATPAQMRIIWRIAVYALLMGVAGGAISRFLALFAEEEMGLSTTVAGLIVALSGLVGMPARIVAGRLAEEKMAPMRLLALIATIGAAVTVLLALTTTIGAWLLWPIAVGFAIGHGAWNAVAMLAVIMGVPQRAAGRASGITMLGFLGGLALGGPLAGLSIDATGSYQPIWIGTTVLAVLAVLVVRPRDGSRPGVAVSAE